MENKGPKRRHPATTLIPNPGQFPIGSKLSRAAARAMLRTRAAVADTEKEAVRVLAVVVMPAGFDLTPSMEARIDREIEQARARGEQCCLLFTPNETRQDLMPEAPTR